MEHGKISERELGFVFTEIKLLPHSGDDCDVSATVNFIFKTLRDNGNPEGPSITCEFATDVTDSRAIEVQSEAVDLAMRMVRHLAAMADEDILQTCRNSTQWAADRSNR